MGLLTALFTFLLLRQTRSHCFEPLPRFLEIFSRHLAAFLLEAVENVDHIIYSLQVNDAVPGPLVLIPQFKNAQAERR